MRGVLLALAFAASAASALVAAQTYKAGETFDYVFRIVRETDFDPSFDTAKWDQIGKDLRPKAVDHRPKAVEETSPDQPRRS